MIHLQISETFQALVSEEVLTKAAEAALAHIGVAPNCELSIVVDDDAALQTLNHDYLGIDAPTDVLSFPADETDPDSGNRYLGDIIVSFPRAQAQAESAGHPVEAELQLLVVHGVLHLLGMDHAEPEEKHAMWQSQAEILRSLGSKLARWPEE